MEKRPARVAAIHDLSGFGRCSISVILPVLSAMGVQVCPVPTAVLSTHTGGFGEVVFRDLTDYIKPTLEHYKNLDIDFEAVYSGFLGSEEQVDSCLEFFKSYPKSLKIVDPVMGDNGKAYKTCTKSLQNRMKELVAVADVITPNLTEAAMLLGEPYRTEPMTVTEARSLLLRLHGLGPKMIVVTGAELATGMLANICYDGEHGSFWYSPCEYLPVHYPGCGDIFASVLIGAMLGGASLPIAIGKATEFIELCVKTTFSYGSDPRQGVMLESVLGSLIRGDSTGIYKTL
ncbi:MAG: pyridoxamine kinase [Oscillospiraceae bacterium]|nr:pyridoxamine kinase [Oscillospiraceae bacterium]MBQ2794988.1 pyridoxamine kinase [Oscillospiraceae bacterium]MBQ2998024.1 pyridoxamine kinase [Oscillospiraceae bacterium]MBQ3237232.1 pyridoxamine kinase [Oscillospiraceae bacterium]MBQ4118051.1 pyridoxamine kinase [Oscillospiraceae bacterium]